MKIGSWSKNNNYQRLQLNQGGFTLIEFLVVTVLLGIVGVLGAMAFMPSMEKARDGKRKADLNNISQVLEAYHNDYGRYPSSTATGTIQACSQSGSQVGCDWGAAMVDGKGTVYMAKLPADPKAFAYHYLADADGNWYVLLSRLENELDPTRAVTEDSNPQAGVYTLANPVLSNTACGGEGCSYVHYGPTERPDLIVVPAESEGNKLGGEGSEGEVVLPP